MDNNTSSMQQLNELARRARSGTEADVRLFAKAIFDSSLLSDAYVNGAAQERVIKAELQYRVGKHPGIAEQNIVNAINSFAKRTGAPDYAMSSPMQVRMLRVGLMLQVPQIIAPSSSANAEQLPEMSPLEATFVTLSLIHQKLYNPAFQVTPEEWQSNRYKDRVSKMQPPPGSMNEAPQGIQWHASERSRSIQLAFREHSKGKSVSELQELLNEGLDLLGIGMDVQQ